MELYDLEKRAIQIDTEKYEYDNSSEHTDNTISSQRAEDYSSQRADDYSSQRADDYSSQRAEDYSSQRAEDCSSQRADDDNENDDILQTQVSHVHLPTNGENTMLIMMKIHCVKWFTDQRMCHTMNTARNYCCRKQQICHEKTI